MAFAHSFPIDGTKPQDDDTISNEYPGPFDLTAAKAGSRMTGGVPEDDIALRVLQVLVQAPPLLLSTANHSFTDDVHGEHVPQRVQSTPRWISSGCGCAATRCKLQC